MSAPTAETAGLLEHPGLSVLRDQFVQESPLWGDYTLGLSWEGIGRIDCLTRPESQGLSAVMDWKRRRGESPGAIIPYEHQPFGCLEFFLWERTGDDRYLEAIHAETRRWVREAERDCEGNFMHQGGYLLIDRLQDYAGRCIRIGCLRDDEELVEEGLRQWQSQSKILRFPISGLWSQGRNWVAPGVLSPGAWSRGQGWLLRGLTESLIDLPAGYDGRKLVERLLQSLVEPLLQNQAPDGSWHRILSRSPMASLPDSSGTGMILGYLSLALRKRWIDPVPGLEEGLQRAEDFLAGSLTEEGTVLHGCPGPGPLEGEEEYLGQVRPSPVNEPHAVFAWFLGAALSHPKG